MMLPTLGAIILTLAAKTTRCRPSDMNIIQKPLTLLSLFCLVQVVAACAAQEPAWNPTPEQIASAKQLAADLGVVLKEDGSGNVVVLNTAAKRSWVDDYQMQEMLAFPHLQSLTVEGPSISDQLVPQISRQSSLTSLAMHNTLIGDEGISQLVKLKALKIIDLRLSPLVTDKTAKTLAHMSSLRAVRISGINITDVGLKQLLLLPQLTELDVRNCRGVSKTGIGAFAKKKSLRVLKIGGGRINDSVLGVVAQMNQLSGLPLDNCDISDEGVALLRSLSLIDLTIYQSAKVTDKGLAVLAAFNDLKKLTLRDVPATCA
jgi:hypothetical protein